MVFYRNTWYIWEGKACKTFVMSFSCTKVIFGKLTPKNFEIASNLLTRADVAYQLFRVKLCFKLAI